MFPALYHAQHSQYKEDLPFWSGLARSPSRRVLELGCGTGRVLIPLADEGHSVVGLDLDPGMLQFLHDKIPIQLKDRVLLFQADMAHFRLAERFQTILVPCNTLSTLSVKDRQATLVNIRRHLCDDGIFAASVPNPRVLSTLPRHGETEIDEIFFHPLSGNPVQVSNSWVKSSQSCTFNWHYDELFSDGTVQRLTVHSQHSLAPAEIYIEELRQAGLEVTDLFGDFDRSAYTADSPYLLLKAAIHPET